MKRVRQPLQVALKDPVDGMYMVQDTHEIRRVLGAQPIEAGGNDFMKASICPLFEANEL
jgi:hypothetical protein